MLTPGGPATIQQLQIEINKLREEVRANRIQTGPTVRASKTAGGTHLRAARKTPPATNSVSGWG